MKSSTPQGDAHAFVVRIWYEADEPGGEECAWRGSADHVSSGNRCYFSDLEALFGFIREQAQIGSTADAVEGHEAT